MVIRRCAIVFTLLAVSFLSFDQRLKKTDKAIVTSLQSHIGYLSDDKLEGRRAGTNGEKLAREYISKQFEKVGLQPRGDNNGWYQAFEIPDGKQVNSSTHLFINGNELLLHKEFFPLVFSPSHNGEYAVVMALSESGVPWFMDLKETLEENKQNPHFDLNEFLKARANSIGEKGAKALIIFNTSDIEDDVQFKGRDRSDPVKIPVVYITREARKKYLTDESATLDIKLKVDIGNKTRTGNNVIGHIYNNASKTIVLGAHYDHLGYGEDGNSLFRNTEKQIHNGADDNASGTAALIELARLLKQSKNKSNNYLFIAFSGEELGLNGSKYFTEHATVDLSQINYMINLDMVGRLNDSKALTIGGYGTSPSWSQIFNALDNKKYFTIKYDSSGTGPSDHTSFYRKNIPVLFFFTGIHSDYHKPSDDFDKINYVGELQIIKYIVEVIGATNNKGKLAFNKTREMQMGSTARFSVTLGIMPDYTFGGNGVKVDGVSDGRPAQKAGIQAGDVIVQLGDHTTSSVETYMQALSKFKKGDKVKVKYKRKDDTVETEVQF